MRYLILALLFVIAGCVTAPDMTNWSEEDKQRYHEKQQAFIQQHNDNMKSMRNNPDDFKNNYQAPVQQNYQASQPVKQIDYNCMNTCQQSGHIYGFCQSKCSY